MVRRIAAGEVIENPASALKELVENALDAGASEITIRYAGGGLQLLEVAYDGCGMSAEEAPLAFARHATSKIREAEDLLRLRTLGFRGEARASLCAVAEVTLFTSDGSHPGVRVRAREGRVVEVRPHPHDRGTRVLVEQLFRYHPVRRKFLRSPPTEGARLLRLFRRYAIAFPEVRWRLARNGQVVDLPPEAPTARLARLFPEFARHAIPFQAESAVGNARGFVAPPGTRSGIQGRAWIFVNRRPIRAEPFLPWLREALRYEAPERLPFVLLFLEVPPETVDFNIHPAKWEVSFREAESIRSLVVNAVRSAFWKGTSQHKKPWKEAPQRPARLLEDRTFRVVGQVFQSFIAVETDEEFLLLDQHVIAERVLYDRMKHADPLPSQSLLIPHPLSLSPEERALLREYADLFTRAGFRWQEGDTLLLTGIPFYLTAPEAEARLREALAELPQGSVALPTPGDFLNRLACRLAVKAQTPLPRSAMERLVELWRRCDNPFVCPHGRPIFIRLERKELHRSFLRPAP